MKSFNDIIILYWYFLDIHMLSGHILVLTADTLSEHWNKNKFYLSKCREVSPTKLFWLCKVHLSLLVIRVQCHGHTAHQGLPLGNLYIAVSLSVSPIITGARWCGESMWPTGKVVKMALSTYTAMKVSFHFATSNTALFVSVCSFSGYYRYRRCYSQYRHQSYIINQVLPVWWVHF